MKKIIRSVVIAAMACLAGVMAGCGSGGSGSSAPPATETKLTLTVAAAPSGTLIGGVQGKITLPEGYSVRTQADGVTVLSEVFSASGSAASSLSNAGFTNATRVVTYAVVNAYGFPGGDFATLLVQIPAGGVPVKAADVVLSENQVIDNTPDTTPETNNLNLPITVR